MFKLFRYVVGAKVPRVEDYKNIIDLGYNN